MTDQLVKYTMFLYPEVCRVAKSLSAGNTGDARAKVAKTDKAASAAFREKCTIVRNRVQEDATVLVSLSASDEERVPVLACEMTLYSQVFLHFAPYFPGSTTQGRRDVAFGQATRASNLKFGQGATS